ncbi:MAG: helix-turn-helix domain-containing protein, partial [Chloroflexi bacterium]|nr:helix-turn-helix domain-containing protein [Chloroflexota bacterium]
MAIFSRSFFEQEEHHPSRASAHYHAAFFGPFRVIYNQQPLGEPQWRRNKAKALLKWFLLNPGDLFSVEQLSKLFWPEIPIKVAASNLHVTLHYLRHVLEPELASGRPSTFIRRNRYNYYWFDLHDDWWTDLSDIQHLSTLIKEAERAADFLRAITLSCQLVSYYSLTFLPEDIYEDMFAPYRRQYEYVHTQSLEHLMRLYVQTDRFDDALSCALHTLSVDPYNEDAVKTMVRVYLRQGNVTAALCQL